MHWKVTLVVGRLLGYSCITKLYNPFFDVQIVYIQYYYAIASFVIACDMCFLGGALSHDDGDEVQSPLES